ncbi:MAG: hypothetical protein ACRYF8_01645 [Janthinobacterium lividum]
MVEGDQRAGGHIADETIGAIAAIAEARALQLAALVQEGYWVGGDTVQKRGARLILMIFLQRLFTIYPCMFYPTSEQTSSSETKTYSFK